MTSITNRMPRTMAALAATSLTALAMVAATPASATTATCTPICVLDTRAGAHTDFDRLVLDLSDGTMPTGQITVSADGTYPTPGGDIRTMQIAGKSYLILDVATAHTYSDNGTYVYTSPTVQTIGLLSLKGVQLLSDSEGHVDFGLSLGDYSRYQVFTLTSPNRLVIDLYH